MRIASSVVSVLLLSGFAAGCGLNQHPLVVEPASVGADSFEIVWDRAPARIIDVFRCVEVCPALESLPTYKTEYRPRPGKPVWRVSGVDSPANGHGIIPSPVRYGEAGVEGVIEELAPAPLTPGDYLVRIVTFEGRGLDSSWGTGWSMVSVGGPVSSAD